MDKVRKILELLANAAIIIVAVLLSTVLVKDYLFRTPSAMSGNDVQLPSVEARRGEKLSLPDVDWQKNGQTLLLALSTTCHFCSESAPFYKQLINERAGVRIIAVLPQSVDDGKRYLERLGISVDEVRQAPLTSIGVSGTPTLFLIDGTGTGKAVWLGKLQAAQESEVLNQVRLVSVQR